MKRQMIHLLFQGMKSIFFPCGPLMTGHRFTKAVIWEIVLWMGGIILYIPSKRI